MLQYKKEPLEILAVGVSGSLGKVCPLVFQD